MTGADPGAGPRTGPGTGPASRPAARLLRPDVAGGAALLALGVFALLSSRNLPFGTPARPGAGFFPIILSVALTGLGTLIALQGLLKAGPDLRALWTDAAGTRRVCVVALILLIGIAAIDTIGFAITTSLICGAMARFVGRRRWTAATVFGVATGVICWLVFQHWLRVNLPLGRLFE